MFTRTLILSLAALALADPIPQAASPAPTSFDSSAATSIPSDASLSAALQSESSLESLLSGIPTLASTIENQLISAIPTTLAVTDIGCAVITSEPGWYQSLPSDVKSALTSYELAVESWYSVHSSQLAALTSGYTVTVPTYTGCGAATGATGTVAGGTVTSTSAAGKTTATGTSSGAKTSASGTGSAGTVSASGSGTAAGSAASSTKATGAAPKATGAVAVGIAGLVGMVGVMVAL